jgi:hypothetical protein
MKIAVAAIGLILRDIASGKNTNILSKKRITETLANNGKSTSLAFKDPTKIKYEIKIRKIKIAIPSNKFPKLLTDSLDTILLPPRNLF